MTDAVDPSPPSMGFRCLSGHPAMSAGLTCSVCGQPTVVVYTEAAPDSTAPIGSSTPASADFAAPTASGPAGSTTATPTTATPAPANPATPTSGVAITALIMSVLWLGGLGSIVGIVLGISARRAIRRSNGTVQGGGLAMAGVIVGICGIVVAAILWPTLIKDGINTNKAVNQVNNALTPHTVTLSLGQSAQMAANDPNGLSSIQVTAFTNPEPSPDLLIQPGPGKQFALIALTICAGPNGSQAGPNKIGFTVSVPGNSPLEPSFINVVNPGALYITSLAPGTCSSGYLTFTINTGSTPTAFQYQSDLNHIYKWTLPSTSAA